MNDAQPPSVPLDSRDPSTVLWWIDGELRIVSHRGSAWNDTRLQKKLEIRDRHLAAMFAELRDLECDDEEETPEE